MMGKSRNRFRRERQWQSNDLNKIAYAYNYDMILSLAVNRFRWVGLPDTCDSRFLEMQLHTKGIATICKNPEGDYWESLLACPFGDYNVYGLPVSWKAQGYATGELYTVTPDTGELVYYSQTRMNPWIAFDYFALKLTDYDRAEQSNLTHQSKPFVFIAPQEKKLELVNLLKQVEGFEPAVLGDSNFLEIAQSVTAIDTKVPLITEDLALSRQNVLNQLLLYLGIPHLAFEKGERMIEDEARANSMPTGVMLLNCLNARRQACKELNRRFGLELEVYFNEDWESYNFNYINNVEATTQDGFGEGGEPA